MEADLLRETRETVARIEVKVDHLIDLAADHEVRIRGLERWRWGIPGSLLAALVSLFAGSQ